MTAAAAKPKARPPVVGHLGAATLLEGGQGEGGLGLDGAEGAAGLVAPHVGQHESGPARGSPTWTARARVAISPGTDPALAPSDVGRLGHRGEAVLDPPAHGQGPAVGGQADREPQGRPGRGTTGGGARCGPGRRPTSTRPEPQRADQAAHHGRGPAVLVAGGHVEDLVGQLLGLVPAALREADEGEQAPGPGPAHHLVDLVEQLEAPG